MKKAPKQHLSYHWITNNRYLIVSCALFVLSLFTLCIAMSVARERTHIPYSGIAINHAITAGSSTLTVTKVEHKPSKQPFVAPTGYEYLIVTIRIRNNGESPFSVFPTSDTYIKTGEGKVSFVTPYDLSNPFHSGLILPGEATEGELSYVVPRSGQYKFYIESSWTSTAVPFAVLPNQKAGK